MNRFLGLVRRDLALGLRQNGTMVATLTFFVLAVALFPLGVGPEPATLARIAPGVVWVAAQLAATDSLDRLFQADYEDGSLELLLLEPLPLELAVLAKCLAHWLLTGLPLTLISPLLGVLMQLHPDGLVVLTLAMAAGTPALSLIGAIGAALTVGVRRGGVLLSLLVLPLMIPVLIFGVAAVDAATQGLGARPHLLLLGGLSVGALALSPLAAAAGLRLAVE
ncbi:MAG: heme exporter protein CcmB [Ferrovibrionaceae bacterium]